MSIDFVCCNKKLKHGELWFLKDVKGFTERKLYKAHCPFCDEDVVLYLHKNTQKDKFYSEIIRGIEAVKILYKEKKQRLQIFPDIKTDNLLGWIYGINIEIRDKRKNVVKLKQYSSDFDGNKQLTKVIYAK